MRDDDEMNMPPAVKDLSQGLLPVTIVASLLVGAGFVGFITSKYIGAYDRTNDTVQSISQRQDTMQAQFIEIQREFRAAFILLERKLDQQPADVLRKGDLSHFCLKFERLNKDVKCPENFQ
jgi:hypothetical protein